MFGKGERGRGLRGGGGGGGGSISKSLKTLMERKVAAVVGR